MMIPAFPIDAQFDCVGWSKSDAGTLQIALVASVSSEVDPRFRARLDVTNIVLIEAGMGAGLLLHSHFHFLKMQPSVCRCAYESHTALSFSSACMELILGFGISD